MITATFSGVPFVAQGVPGGFELPVPLLDREQGQMHTGAYHDPVTRKSITESERMGRTIGAAPIDLDSDGDYDLVIGTYTGRVFARINEGTPQKPAFATDVSPFPSKKKGAWFKGEYAIPYVCDWDGDGFQDILSGGSEGGIFWMRNEGRGKKARFSSPKVIVSAKATKSAGVGERTQVSAGDFDGDGDLDLLVGDYHPEGNHGYVWLYRRK